MRERQGASDVWLQKAGCRTSVEVEFKAILAR